MGSWELLDMTEWLSWTDVEKGQSGMKLNAGQNIHLVQSLHNTHNHLFQNRSLQSEFLASKFYLARLAWAEMHCLPSVLCPPDGAILRHRCNLGLPNLKPNPSNLLLRHCLLFVSKWSLRLADQSLAYGSSCSILQNLICLHSFPLNPDLSHES